MDSHLDLYPKNLSSILSVVKEQQPCDINLFNRLEVSLDVAIEENLVECCTTQSVRTQNQIRVVGSPEVSFPSVPKKLGVRVIASYQKTQLFPKAQFSSLQVISAHFLFLGFYAILSYFSRVFLA